MLAPSVQTTQAENECCPPQDNEQLIWKCQGLQGTQEVNIATENRVLFACTCESKRCHFGVTVTQFFPSREHGGNMII